jgi:hypothetical protein
MHGVPIGPFAAPHSCAWAVLVWSSLTQRPHSDCWAEHLVCAFCERASDRARRGRRRSSAGRRGAAKWSAALAAAKWSAALAAAKRAVPLAVGVQCRGRSESRLQGGSVTAGESPRATYAGPRPTRTRQRANLGRGQHPRRTLAWLPERSAGLADPHAALSARRAPSPRRRRRARRSRPRSPDASGFQARSLRAHRRTLAP